MIDTRKVAYTRHIYAHHYLQQPRKIWHFNIYDNPAFIIKDLFYRQYRIGLITYAGYVK